jgi:nitroreductase
MRGKFNFLTQITKGDNMEIPVQSWHDAVFIRRSRRKYSDRPPEKEKIEKLKDMCENFRPYEEARTVLVENPSEDIFKGFIGSYGKVDNTPFIAVFIGDTRSEHANAALGYTGEGIILEAARLELGTCWVGGFFSQDDARKLVDLNDNEKIFAVTPVGYPTQKVPFQEKVMTGFGATHKRKPLEDLVSGDKPKGWMQKGLDAARVAPSAVNRQPWRFHIEDGSITVSVDKDKSNENISRRLDCGIAMLHLELGARTAGQSGSWEWLSSPQVARFS